MQCACTILSTVACLALQYVSTLSHKRHHFLKKVTNIKCVFNVSLQIFVWVFFILRITERDVIKNVYWVSCKVPIFIVRFELNSNFLDRFSKSSQISNLMKICPVGAEQFHSDGGQKDVT
jgi:hypothetical protein